MTDTQQHQQSEGRADEGDSRSGKNDVQSKFWKAVKHDRLDKIDDLIEDNEEQELLKLRRYGDSICHVAASHGSMNVFKKYSKNLSKDYFRNTENGDTWLHVAFKKDKDEIARYILANFKDYALEHTTNNNRETVIKAAISSSSRSESAKKRSRVLHTIVAAGVTKLIASDLSVRDVDPDNSILHTAAQHGHLDSIRDLIKLLEELLKQKDNDFKAILNAPNKNKETVLHLVGKYSDTVTFLRLIQKGSDIEVTDKSGQTPVDNLITSAHPIGSLEKFLEDLYESNRDSFHKFLEWKNKNHETLLHVACKEGDLAFVKFLLQKGNLVQKPLDIKAIDKSGHTPVDNFIASEHPLGSLEKFLEDLYESNRDSFHKFLEWKNKNDETLLHVACKEGDIDFVKYLLHKGRCLHIKDKAGNTPLHCLVSAISVQSSESYGQSRGMSQNGQNDVVDTFKTFITSLIGRQLDCGCKESENTNLLKKSNKNNQTILTLASKHGNIRIVKFFIQEGIFSPGNSGLYDVICSIETSTDRRIQAVNSLPDEFVEEADKVSKHSILHVIAANGLTPLVAKFQFVDFSKTDSNGDTVLHTAARNKHFKTLQEIINTYADKFDSEKLDSLINKEDTDGETVLHIVCKLADVETVQFLIRKGADLKAQDNSRNTPLHDLVDKAATEDEIDKYTEVWKVFVDNVGWWWCPKLGFNQRDKSRVEYKTYQRKAIYYLRSEILNNQNLSVIPLAATKGLVKLVKEMIWVEDVFITQNSETGRIRIDVTNLMPHLGGGEETDRTKRIRKRFGDEDLRFSDLADCCYDSDGSSVSDTAECCCKCYDSDSEFDKEKCFACGKLTFCFPCILSYLLFGTTHGRHRHSLLDAILKVQQGNKANEIFQIEPMKQLVRDYWFAHQWWTFIMLTVHLIYMTLYSSYCLDMTSKAFGNNETNATSGELIANKAYLIWPFMLAIPYIGLLFASPLIWLFKSGKRKSIKERVIGATRIDVKDIFNWPSVFLSAIVELIPLVVPLMFCIATFGALELTSYNNIFFNNVTSYSVILGWLLTFYWASAFEPVYRFISALQMIILKDVMSFLFFYIFVLLAYSHGIFIVMNSVPSLSQDYPSLNTVMFELLLVGCGADSRMSSDDIASEFEKVGIDSMLFKFLFTSYIVVTMVGLLNLIIASMCDSYKKFTETDNQGWRQHSLKMSRNSIASYFIGSKLLHPLFKKLNIVEKNVSIDKDTGHYYIEMDYKQAMSL